MSLHQRQSSFSMLSNRNPRTFEIYKKEQSIKQQTYQPSNSQQAPPGTPVVVPAQAAPLTTSKPPQMLQQKRLSQMIAPPKQIEFSSPKGNNARFNDIAATIQQQQLQPQYDVSIQSRQGSPFTRQNNISHCSSPKYPLTSNSSIILIKSPSSKTGFSKKIEREKQIFLQESFLEAAERKQQLQDYLNESKRTYLMSTKSTNMNTLSSASILIPSSTNIPAIPAEAPPTNKSPTDDHNTSKSRNNFNHNPEDQLQTSLGYLSRKHSFVSPCRKSNNTSNQANYSNTFSRMFQENQNRVLSPSSYNNNSIMHLDKQKSAFVKSILKSPSSISSKANRSITPNRSSSTLQSPKPILNKDYRSGSFFTTYNNDGNHNINYTNNKENVFRPTAQSIHQYPSNPPQSARKCTRQYETVDATSNPPTTSSATSRINKIYSSNALTHKQKFTEDHICLNWSQSVLLDDQPEQTNAMEVPSFTCNPTKPTAIQFLKYL